MEGGASADDADDDDGIIVVAAAEAAARRCYNMSNILVTAGQRIWQRRRAYVYLLSDIRKLFTNTL
jgi:hypothetical protein